MTEKMVCSTVDEAMAAAERAEKEDLRGLYPSAVRVLANYVHTLYRCIDLEENPDDKTPVRYVGVYVRMWGSSDQPTVSFTRAWVPLEDREWWASLSCEMEVTE